MMGSKFSAFISVFHRKSRHVPRIGTDDATIYVNKYALSEEHITYLLPIELLDGNIYTDGDEVEIQYQDQKQAWASELNKNPGQTILVKSSEWNSLNQLHHTEIGSPSPIKLGIPLPVTFKNGKPVITAPITKTAPVMSPGNAIILENPAATRVTNVVKEKAKNIKNERVRRQTVQAIIESSSKNDEMKGSNEGRVRSSSTSTNKRGKEKTENTDNKGSVETQQIDTKDVKQKPSKSDKKQAEESTKTDTTKQDSQQIEQPEKTAEVDVKQKHNTDIKSKKSTSKQSKTTAETNSYTTAAKDDNPKTKEERLHHANSSTSLPAIKEAQVSNIHRSETNISTPSIHKLEIKTSTSSINKLEMNLSTSPINKQETNMNTSPTNKPETNISTSPIQKVCDTSVMKKDTALAEAADSITSAQINKLESDTNNKPRKKSKRVMRHKSSYDSSTTYHKDAVLLHDTGTKSEKYIGTTDRSMDVTRPSVDKQSAQSTTNRKTSEKNTTATPRPSIEKIQMKSVELTANRKTTGAEKQGGTKTDTTKNKQLPATGASQQVQP